MRLESKQLLLAFLIFIGILFVFFSPLVRGFLPFPGDLLVGHYSPWNGYSFLGFAPGGVPHKAQGIDVVRELFPWKYFSTQVLKAGELPLWNPYNFSGNPHMANFQTAIFYPLSLIFLLLPFNLAWSHFIIMQNLLACFFTFLFLRTIKLSFWAAVFGAMAFTYSLFFTVWLEYGNIGHALLWLPFCLFLAEKITADLRLKWILLLTFSFAFSIAAGHIQTTIYLFAFVYFYLLFRVGFRKTLMLSLSGVAALLLMAVQLLPTLEIFSFSAREAYPAQIIGRLLLPLAALINVFAADFFGNPASRNYWLPGTYIERVLYIGVLPLFFSLLAIFVQRRVRIVKFFFWVLVIVLGLSLNWLPARIFYGLKIPIISTTVPTRMLYLFSFSLAVLASFGLDWYLKTQKHKRLILKVFIGFVVVYVLFWFFTWLSPIIFPNSWWISHLRISQRNLILPTIFAFSGGIIFLGKLMKKRYLLSAIFFFTIFDLFFYFKKITPFSPPEFVYPSTEVMGFINKEGGINRFWGYGTGYIDTNFSTLLKNYSPEGNDPLFIRRYGELISSAENGQIKKPLPRADVEIAKGYGPEALKSNSYRQKLINLLGVKYLLQKNDILAENWQPDYTTFPPENYRLVWQEGCWQVYENLKAWPRIFLVGDYEFENEPQKIIDLIYNPNFDLRTKAILEEKLSDGLRLDKKADGEVKIVDYQPNQIELETNSTGEKLLIITDNYFPGWQATIDGQPAKIYRADYAFRAVAVPGGYHQVKFIYRPGSVRVGAAVSLSSLLVISIISLWLKKSGRIS